VKRILACDDEAVNRKLLARLLTSENTEAKVVESGEVLLDTVKTYNPDLIMLDVHMPGITGIQTLDSLKLMGFLKKIPVVMLSGVGDQQTVLSAAQLGASGFMVKPISRKSLFAGISPYLITIDENQVEDFLKNSKDSNVSLLSEKGIADEVGKLDTAYPAHTENVELAVVIANGISIEDLVVTKSKKITDCASVYAKGQLRWHKVWPNLLDFMNF
jgi:CheY-like chemotaxis protein